MQNTSIIVADDDQNNRDNIQAVLVKAGYDVQIVGTGGEAIRQFKSNHHHIVITKLNLPDLSGLEVLSDIKKISQSTPVLMLAPNGTVNDAVEAMQRGAADFLVKPVDLQSILISVRKIVESQKKEEQGDRPSEIISHVSNTKKLITDSPNMLQVLAYAKKVARSSASVLIQGESGTGKELLADFIVQNSGREKEPFVAMNCAALPDNLAESELFGHEKGAFTGAFQKRIGKFEQASGGTLLLDEVSELSLPLQAKLLRALQEKVIDRLGGRQPISIDTRVICTCNVDLKQSVRKGEFREDLFYRINVVPMVIPPLRDRKEDIPKLVDHFIHKFNAANLRSVEGISEGAVERILAYDWPGNVRELENVIERAVLIADQNLIMIGDLLIEADASSEDEEFRVGTTVRDMEKKLIFRTLKQVNENRTYAAELLGISIRTLRNKLREYRDEVSEEEYQAPQDNPSGKMWSYPRK